MDIQLFLARADNHEPILAGGLPRRSVYAAPKPLTGPVAPSELENRSGPLDSLAEQRWGVVAPKGAVGDRLLRLIEPLLRQREEEQGSSAIVYRIDPQMRASATHAWLQRDYWNAVGRRARDLPRYLLLLGDPSLVSWDFQQMLGGEAFVGRLAFDDDQGYEAYVEKVLRCAAETRAEGARSLFYTVRDGTPATAQGYRHLVAPSVEGAREGLRSGWFPATEIHEIGSGDGMFTADELTAMAQQMLREAERSRAGLLFSLGHGAGAPRQGWRSPEEQRAEQGALVLGRERLTARDLAARPFLPGGLWFLFACFGAGTPARSAYYHWLARLHEMGMSGPAEHVLDALPRGAPPFVASLPQAALANPAGPLGVLGHVDLAWTWSFLDHGSPEAGAGPRRRAERFQGLLRALVQGHRFGPAHHEITRFFGSLSTELSTMYDEDAEPGGPRAGGDGPREAARAGLWMQRQDLGAYVLLGDPAARLPISRWPEGVRAPASGLAAPPQVPAGDPSLALVMGFDVAPQASPARPQPSGTGGPEVMAEAVLAVLRGGGERVTAQRYGIEEAELRRGVGAFLEGGRAALRERA